MTRTVTVCGCPMRIDGVTYGKLKTLLKVNGNLDWKKVILAIGKKYRVTQYHR